MFRSQLAAVLSDGCELWISLAKDRLMPHNHGIMITKTRISPGKTAGVLAVAATAMAGLLPGSPALAAPPTPQPPRTRPPAAPCRSGLVHTPLPTPPPPPPAAPHSAP